MQNHYQTLGLPVGASLEAVQDAYKQALRRFLHNKQAGTPLPQAEFDALQAAYDALGAVERKAVYDESLASPAEAKATPPPPAQNPAHASDLALSALYSAPTRSAKVAPESADNGITTHRFEFTGSGGEYFRIWIVNLLLTILTLGIYSAWAKVRREQYFRRNTLLNGSGFDYHGNPKAILKGRVIAWSLLLVLTISEKLNPVYYVIAILLLSPALPWLLWRSFRFRARNTSWRGLRFDFESGYLAAFTTFIAYGLLTLVTLGLAFPLQLLRIKQFMLNNLSFGGFNFKTEATSKDFYIVFLIAVVAGMGGFVAIIIAGTVLGMMLGKLASSIVMMVMIGILIFVLYVLIMPLVITYVQVNLANRLWNKTSLSRHQFECDQRLGAMFAIVITNWLLIMLTAGLYWPWAKIRLAAYRARHLSLIAAGSLDEFVSYNTAEQQALGEGFADAFDFDIAL
ncbi:membrane protein [Betaproteobacteria bacterium]|nr:membrane protein [Betaproteobacteria bacterium]GHU47237.1 membrane protein [Betaproteobacteria bacterium]